MVSTPNEYIASEVVENVMGCKAQSIHRFTTGNHHYVYDVNLENGRNIVIRMTLSAECESMEGALKWNNRLRKLSIPLPEIYFCNLNFEFPFLIMERLQGRDLGFEIEQMTELDLQTLAHQLIKFQKIVGGLPTVGKFGYATEPEIASENSWTEVLKKSIDRSRKRIELIGFVDPRCFLKLEDLLVSCQDQLKNITAMPFLHDITTKNVIISKGKLTGIVDVDNLCFGDPLFQVALTRMALLGQGINTSYIDYLLNEYGTYSKDLLRLYTAECCVGFLSELGQPFNGNVIDASMEIKNHLESILHSL